MKNLIKRNLDGKRILFLFILTSILYALMLTITIPKVMNYSSGMKLLDMIPTGYSPAYVNLLFTSLGELGRDAYLFKQIPVDMIYPLMFAISYSLILAFFLKKLGKLDGIFFYVCYIPLFSGLFDYFENIGIITMLNAYPNNSNLLAQTTNIFSLFKSVCTTFTFIILIAFLIILGLRNLKSIR